ncbi:MAG: sialidase family protein, partial [Pirellulales bacterium]
YNSQDQLFQTNLVNQGGPFALAVAKINTSGGSSTSTVVDQAPSGAGDDRQVMAADSNPSSPYRNNLYVIWSENGINGPIRVSRSTDNGATWSNTQTIGSERFAWQPSITVGPNGYVYAAYHAQPGQNTYTDSTGKTQAAVYEPDGTSGEVFVAVSKDGGQTYTFPTDGGGSKIPVFGAGQADVTWNVQAYAANQAANRTIPGARFLTAGSSSPVVIAGPGGRVYSIVADDPSNGGTSGNLADLRIATSTNYGSTWGPSQLLESGPGNSFQLFPAAAVDKFGDIVVTWYDNRNGAKNSSGDYLLDVFAKYSTDGGATWSPAVQINAPNDPFDPRNGAPALTNGFPAPPNTYRIGEYISTAVYGGTAYVAWTGNSRDIYGNIT